MAVPMNRNALNNSPTAIEMARRAQTVVDPPRGASIEHIIHVAADLFAARGFDAVTMDEIAEAVGVPRRSLYRRFRYKDEFLVRWMLRINDQICAALARQPVEAAPLAAILGALREIEEFRGEPLRRIRIMHQITAGSLNAQSAALTTQLVWEEEMAHVLAQRQPGQPDAFEHGRLMAGVALVGLRAAFARWNALPEAKANRAALFRSLEAVFAAITQSGN
ncbi:TetR/AcrR family transcriptional regulator [Novosphingobium sp.]|uniref:TetR/AcrR family transcriptional regulator n=1 Tax=Novosphingobium sp. TaxID=1874826 RepID=UPI0026205D9C|nr:TetR/AcrR family transcriptional regulator [Novosphingobium sp.]